MISALLCCLFLHPPVHDDHKDAELLKTFRSEFVLLQPGKNKAHPAVFAYQGKSDIKIHSFAICKYELTQNLWRKVMGKNPSRWQGERNSVEMLSFAEAAEFCNKVTERLRHEKLIDANQFVRLPTEIEWEYATRAGTDTKYSFGNDLKQLNDHAWSTDNAAGNDPAVGEKKPNGWDLFDVHGYLWEWCIATDPKKPVAFLNREDWQKESGKDQQVLRGGSWKDAAEKLTSGFRRIEKASTRDDAIGLRCILVRDQK